MSYIVMKQKILFIMHMPPPVHGAAMVGQYIHDSKLINGEFDCHYINLTTAKNLQDIGKVGMRKLFDFFKLLRKIRHEVKVVNLNWCMLRLMLVAVLSIRTLWWFRC